MVEEEKKKSSGAGGISDAGERIIIFIIVLLILAFFFYRFGGGEDFGGNLKDEWLEYYRQSAFGEALSRFLFWFKFVSVYISLAFILGISYLVARLTALNKKERALYGDSQEFDVISPKIEVKKWDRVEKHLASPNPSDWRLAILEADIMLEEMMESSGFLGETLGDKLKNTDKNRFTTLDQAWEAHKIRNLIAHEGSNFLISEREAKRVIALYKEVFDEFRYV